MYDIVGFPKDDALSLLNLTQDPTSLSIKWQKTQDEKRKATQELVNSQKDNQPVNEGINAE